MATQIDREGNFRGYITDYALAASKTDGSKATAIRIQFQITEYYNRETEEWEDWSAFDFSVYGSIWLVKKDGAINT